VRLRQELRVKRLTKTSNKGLHLRNALSTTAKRLESKTASLTNVYFGKPARIKVGRTVSTMKLTAFLPPLNDTLFKNAGRSKGDPIGSRQERNGVRGNNRSPQRNGHRGNNHYGHGYSTNSDHL
jgi:hypothetical protein